MTEDTLSLPEFVEKQLSNMEKNNVGILNILNDLYSPNKPWEIFKPEPTRWNRKYTELAEWYYKVHDQRYPKPEGFYISEAFNKIELPQLKLDLV